jgi:hypothetical protein
MSTTARKVTADAPVYTTKYALTAGIQTFTEGEITQVDGHFYFKGPGEFWSLLKLNKDAWEERESAEADARHKACRKLQSLERQRVKLLALAEEARWEKA